MKIEQPFEEMSWHDNHVHSLSIEAGGDGTGQPNLDIDHITEWLCEQDGSYSFMLAPSTLTFHEVFNLAISINYAAPPISIGPFSIHQIHREPFQYSSGYNSYKWRIELNCPSGEITFEAPRFTQQARKEAIKSEHQYLSIEVRSECCGKFLAKRSA